MITPLQPKIAIPLNRYSVEPGAEAEKEQKCLQNPHRHLEARWIWDEDHHLQCQWVKVNERDEFPFAKPPKRPSRDCAPCPLPN